MKKRIPDGAVQHITAGPYSPVIEVDCTKLVVISGQAPLDLEGNIVGQTIEEQARCVLLNCQRQLDYAGCTFHDVFKCVVYMTDLEDWSRFNAVYCEMIPEPHPVRTAIGVDLLPGFRVEIEMWAVK